MKSFKILLAAACMSSGMFVAGCTTTHSESDHDTMMGGHKHEETTTTKNPITGDVSTEHTETKTK